MSFFFFFFSYFKAGYLLLFLSGEGSQYMKVASFTNSSCMSARYVPGKTYRICSYPEYNEKEHPCLEALVVVWHYELFTGSTSLRH